jgi:hypothetical protein
MRMTDELPSTDRSNASSPPCGNGRRLAKYVYAHLAAVLVCALVTSLDQAHRMPPQGSVAGLALGGAFSMSLVALFVCPTVVIRSTKACQGDATWSDWFALDAEIGLIFTQLFVLLPLAQ